MSKLLYILILATAMVSCKTAQVAVRTIVKDSLVVVEKTTHTRDTTYLPGDTLEISVAIPCPDAVVNQQVKTGRSKLTVQLQRGQLTVNCHTDSLLTIIDSLTSTIERNAMHTEMVEVPIDKPVPYIPKWVWWLVAINVIGLLYLNRHTIIKLVTKL